MPSPRVAAIALISAVLIAASARLWGASPIPGLGADDTISTAQIESAISAVEVREGLEDDARSKVIDQLRDAQLQIQNKLSAEAAAAAFAGAIQTAPAQTKALRAEFDKDPGPAPTVDSLGVREDMPLADVDAVLARELAELASAEAGLADVVARIQVEEGRPARARERIGLLRKSLDELTAASEAAPLPGEPTMLAEARALAAKLGRDATNAALNRLEQELLSHDARLILLQTQRDLAARSLARQRQRAEIVQALLNEKRQSVAAQAQEEANLAELAAADKHPVVRALAQVNATLAGELPAAAADIERITGEQGRYEAEARQIEENLALSRLRLEVGGVSQAIGRLFVEERSNLPQVSQYRAALREREKKLASIGLAQVRLVEQRRELTPLEARVEQAMAEVTLHVTNESELASIRVEVESLLRDRRDRLDEAASTYRSYLRALGDLDISQRRLLNAAAAYQQFLDEHLLWIPSASAFGLVAAQNLAPALQWSLSPTSWSTTAGAMVDALRENPAYAVATLLLLGLALASRRPLSVRFKALNSKVGRLSTDHIGLTLEALAIAVLRALPVPLTLIILSWALERSPLPTDFGAAVALGLAAVAPFLYNTLLFRVMCAKHGIMRVHFRWDEDNLVVIRRQLDRITAIGVPIAFVAVFAYHSQFPDYRESLGRVAFVAMMLVLSAVAHRLHHPVSGVAATYYRRQSRGWIVRLRWLWYGISAGLPLVLAIASLVGYQYTAGVLTGLLVDTFWLVLAIIVANLIVLRWIALARRKIAWQLALEKRAARRAEAGEGTETEVEGEIPVVERTPLDLDAVDQQTRRLVQAGLLFVGVLAGWGIWAEVLPALNVLEQVSVWSKIVRVDGQETVAPVTLANLLLALVVVAVTAVASRNLPGLMEIALLQRLTLQPGSRYAINTLLRYVVVMTGTISVLSIIGWNWSRIQWLVAALSVGLGFGLQEIVANFVSGLVILFERPVRVGDTVTVGEITGTVLRVRIRATTITDWDRKEIIVPNKAFITEQVVNWTLSDPITRVVVQVGIAYGSDVQLATRVMQDTLNALPLVLDDPPPMVYFIGFGDSSLDFKLHVYSRQLSDRLPLTHAVHGEILASLRRNGIEIPFPQRDLHLRSGAVGTAGSSGGTADDESN